MSYRITDEQETLETVNFHMLTAMQNEFVFNIDEESTICKGIKVGDLICENDTYSCHAMSRVDQDGFVKVIVTTRGWGVDK